MWRTHDAMGWWMLFSSVLWILFWVLVVTLVVSIFSRRNSPTKPDSAYTPDQLAARRYAVGDISREDFEAIRSELEQARTGS